jgi:threonine dehydrogenase-like Zn-dependent dehydrogenase
MIPSTYKAAVLTAPGRIEIAERPTPALSPGEVLVRVRYAGICGTDLALHSGAYPAALPMVPGHEFAGEVLAVGDPHDLDWIGAGVTAEINNTCLSWNLPDPCPACNAGISNHCQTRTVLGIANCDGIMAELAKVPVRNLHALPETMPLKYGPFVEPLAAAIQTFELTPLSPNETVVVMGAGRLGVLVCKVAALKGARVIAVSGSPYKLQLARKFGAHILIDSTDGNVKSEVMGLTHGLGADVVVEATGTQEGLNSAFDLVRPRGTICAKSTPGTSAHDFPLTRAVVDEIRVQGSRCGPFGKAIRLMARHKIDMDLLISQVFSLDEIVPAFDAARRKFKVLVEVSD